MVTCDLTAYGTESIVQPIFGPENQCKDALGRPNIYIVVTR